MPKLIPFLLYHVKEHPVLENFHNARAIFLEQSNFRGSWCYGSPHAYFIAIICSFLNCLEINHSTRNANTSMELGKLRNRTKPERNSRVFLIEKIIYVAISGGLAKNIIALQCGTNRSNVNEPRDRTYRNHDAPFPVYIGRYQHHIELYTDLIKTCTM